MSATTRRKRKAATKAERDEQHALSMVEWWKQQRPDRKGHVPGVHHWALRNASGKIVELARACTESALPWTRDGIPAGWSVDTIAAHWYGTRADSGIPAVFVSVKAKRHG